MNNAHAANRIETDKWQPAGSHWFVALADDSLPPSSSFECRLMVGEGRAFLVDLEERAVVRERDFQFRAG